MLPLPPNTTCDVYRAGTAPPAAPGVAGVKCHLTSRFEDRPEVGEQYAVDYRYTHVLLVELGADLRDNQNLLTAGASPDTVYIPDQNGAGFVVRFVERVARGTASDHKRVYLDRKQPTWPTNDL